MQSTKFNGSQGLERKTGDELGAFLDFSLFRIGNSGAFHDRIHFRYLHQFE